MNNIKMVRIQLPQFYFQKYTQLNKAGAKQRVHRSITALNPIQSNIHLY